MRQGDDRGGARDDRRKCRVTGLRRAALIAAALLSVGAASAPREAHKHAEHASAERPRTILAAVPIDRMSLKWWRARHEAVLHRIRSGPVDLLLLGDSITQDWEDTGPESWRDFRPAWNHFYADRHAANLGFKGDTTASLLWRIENGEVAGIAPRAAVLLIGANNFGHVHWSADDTVVGIETIIRTLHTRLPKTHIVLISVLPSIRSAWVDEQTVVTNKALAARFGGGADPLVTYVDVGHLFRDNAGHVLADRFLDPHLTPPDPPLHPTPETQAKIAAAIEPIVARLLGDAPRPGI
jgi:lysophospholipase L1-like esterase